ncbi:MAG: prephenate dehydratase [Armatimonadia bacterium]
MSLDELRERIDSIDQQLLELLHARAEVSREVGALKAAEGREVYDPRREAQLLRSLAERAVPPLTPQAVQAIYREIISASRALQRPPVIAYLGPEHTFSHLAALKHFGAGCSFRPQSSIDDVFAEVERGNAEFGIVPFENSIQGVETRTLDCFVDSPLLICAESYVDVHICLLSKGSIGNVKRVHSHPQPLAQCRQWLRGNLPEAQLVPEASTSAAAAQAAAGDETEAALATAAAAEFYGLHVLAENIEDQPNNRTRFFVIGTSQSGPTGRDKTSVLFTTRHRSGALASALVPLSAHQVNLTLIQSRPSPSRLEGPYIFYVDFEGHETEPMVHAALEGLREQCQTLKVLGSYPVASD